MSILRSKTLRFGYRFEKMMLSKIVRDGEREFDRSKEQWLDEWEAQHLPPPDYIYHYTSADGLLSILEHRQIWATNIMYLNDAMEFSWGRDLALEAMARAMQGRSQVLQSQREWFAEAITQLDIGFPIHVACFCAKDDLLSQWRGYGAGVGGYSIGLNAMPIVIAARKAEGRNAFFRKVIYEKKLQVQLLDELFEKAFTKFDQLGAGLNFDQAKPLLVALWGSFSFLLFQYFFCFKSDTFEEEREWRLVVVPFEAYLHENVCFRVVSNRIAPYLKLDFTPDPPAGFGGFPISSITYGPTPHPDLAERSLRQVLKKRELSYVDIKGSKTPLRA